MSFLDKIAGSPRKADEPVTEGGLPSMMPEDAMERTMRLGPGSMLPDSALPRDEPSIISEAAPSELAADFAESRLSAELDEAPASGLPLIGHWSTARQQRVLLAVFGVGLVLLILIAVLALRNAGRSAAQVTAAGQAQTQSQRLAKSVSQALLGSVPAFAEVNESAEMLARNVRGLASGEGDIPAATDVLHEEVQILLPLVDRAEKSARTVMAQQRALTQAGSSLRNINRQSGELLDLAESVSALKLQQNAPAAEVSAAGQLVMLTQRIGKVANEFQTMEGVGPEAVFQFGKDLNSFKELADGLLAGSAEMHLSAARDPQVRERLQQLQKLFDETRGQAGAILGNLQGLVAARDAHTTIINDSEPLRRGLGTLQQGLVESGGVGLPAMLAAVLAVLLMLVGGLGLLRLFVVDQTARSQVAESQRLEAERQEQEAKRVNDANQAAILRLMNELQTVAEGDLTQQATVTEDITGAIADSVNYTVEELRSLVEAVQSTVARVTETTQQVEQTSIELLAASTEQLREIRETGESVLQMAGRINDVSAQAQQTAQVAHQSLEATESGLTAVQNTIGGMNSIRDQIQDTAKRIKRLGESSQEIGEITELISDITEQTNVLALNAAIQAASAGEAGRGFSVVAEEVQRLAERSGDATRQIAAIVRAIQTDTQDAVAAMERSTQGVVEGARLSDAAGSALADIDGVTRRLAELIGHISDQASREADSANVVAANIQHIFAVTEQTGEGTRSTAQMVRELSRTADDLKASVARFKVS
ncbi:MAG: type IV pili methyl-accepting chemotaxis transducer N-terminal domain-containing protein [Rubrivivax sp.]|nr:type IV pili methyl-accepting chemotaxis transducer N-terminal domain-containing protein [Rubrivivax sp.]